MVKVEKKYLEYQAQSALGGVLAASSLSSEG
jgi:hypothetical protein